MLYISNLEAGSALHSFGHVSEFLADSNTVSLRQGALSVTLDSLVGKYGVPEPALLKIDVDGCEGKILNGGSSVLTSRELRTVLVELNSQDDSEDLKLCQKLAHFGYKLARKSEWVCTVNNIVSQNYVFER